MFGLEAIKLSGNVTWLLPLLVDVVVKSTLLLFVAGLMDAALRQSSAAVRHRLWGIALVALLLLPCLSAIVPQWQIAILPPQWSGRVVEVATVDNPLARASELQSRVVGPEQGTSVAAGKQETVDFAYRASVAGQAGRAAHASSAELASSARALRAAGSSPAPPIPWQLAVLATWGLGALVALQPLALGIYKNARLRRRARPMNDDESLAMMTDLCRRLRLRRRVRLLEADQPIVPMTLGIFRPVVLIPLAWRNWVVESRRLVLLHELAHIQRFDVAYQLLGRVACSAYWFHPLVWYALQRLRVERELACDDCVLRSGERPSDYARQLLEIARGYQTPVLPPAVAMAQRTGLERRVRALLDRARSRLPISPRAGRFLLAGCAVTTGLLAVVRLDAIADQPDGLAATSPPAASESDTPETMEIAGRVLDSGGKPVAGARVMAVRNFQANSTWQSDWELLAETLSGSDGRYALTVPQRSERFSNGTYLELQSTGVVAIAMGYGPDEVAVGDQPDATDLQLATARVPIEGRILDLEGRPIAGVQVSVSEIGKPGAPLEAWLEFAKDNPASVQDEANMASRAAASTARPIAFFPTRERIRAIELTGLHPAVTDSDGRFQIDGIGDDRQATLRIESSKIAVTLLHAVTRDMPAVNTPLGDPRYRSGKAFGSKFTYSAEPAQDIYGTVRDRESGAPIAGAKIEVSQLAGNLLHLAGFLSTETDAEGHYVLGGIPKAPENSPGTRITVFPPRELPYFRSTHQVPARPGLEPIALDIELTSGIWLEGQVTDANTNGAVRSVVAYYPFRDNPNAEGHEGFNRHIMSMGLDESVATDFQGRFRIPGLPGRGAVRVIAENDSEYEIDVGATNLRRGSRWNLYHMGMTGNALVEVNAPEGSETVHVDAQVVPLRSLTLRVADEQGQDVVGFKIAGRVPLERPVFFGRSPTYWDRPASRSASVQVFLGNEQEQRRPLALYHPERSIGAVVDLKTLGASQEVSVTLRPCATIVGRLTRRDGQPVSGGALRAGIGEIQERKILSLTKSGKATSSGPRKFLRHSALDYAYLEGDGRFSYVLPPGEGYSMYLTNTEDGAEPTIFSDLTIGAGETIDLGEINIDADPQTWPEPKRSKRSAARVPSR